MNAQRDAMSIAWLRQASASGGRTPTAPRPVVFKPGARPALARPHISRAALATNANCGETITASLTLNGDLSCTGNGLTVSGKSVVLNINGHEVVGNGSASTGVRVTGTSDTVENGLIFNFANGVEVDGTTDTVTGVRSVGNSGYGINDVGTSTKLTNDTTSFNSVGIIAEASAIGGTYSGDHELTNTYSGVENDGSRITVTGNIAQSNKANGIIDLGSFTTLSKNIPNFNAQDGIYAPDASLTDGGGNTAKGNNWASAGPLPECDGVVCS